MKSYKLLTLTLFAALFISLNVHARGPSVDPITEVDIENERSDKPAKGYDFGATDTATTRTPANIVTHQKNTSPSTYLLPFFILMVMPFGIWYLMSKKSTEETQAQIESFDKVLEETKQAHSDDDDMDFPKAS